MDTLKVTYIVTFLAVVGIAFLGYRNYSNTHVTPVQNTIATTTSEQIATNTVYRNAKYGFEVTLPKSWAGYTVSEEDWEGTPSGSAEVTESGPFIFIHHPLWTEENERQDIPVMVFTLAQWEKLEKEQFHIGAAPINPSELGRNKKYVFALPARYNYSFLPGYEEVDTIIKNGSLKAF